MNPNKHKTPVQQKALRVEIILRACPLLRPGMRVGETRQERRMAP